MRRGNTLVVRSAFGGTKQVLADWQGYPDSWTRDGKYLTAGRPMGNSYELWAVRADGVATEQIPVSFEASPSNDQFAVAADGRFLIRRPVSGSGTDEAPVVVLVNWRKTVGLE